MDRRRQINSGAHACIIPASLVMYLISGVHHLEIHTPDDLDDEVGRWLHDAANRAA
jgi:hypothetical protein